MYDSLIRDATPNAEHQAAHATNACYECHGLLSDTGDCLTGEGQCSRWRPVRDTIEFDDDALTSETGQVMTTLVEEHLHGKHWHAPQAECPKCERPSGKRPRTPAELAHLRRIASSGGRARARRFTKESQSQAAKAKSSEALALAGKKGARATIERHGIAKLVEKLTAWRQDHPSRPEQAMLDLLTANEFVLVDDSSAAHVEEFEREVPVDDAGILRLDFGSRHWRWAIEVRGGCHDVWDTPSHEAQRLAVINEAGWHVLVVRESDLVNRSGRARYAWGLERSVKDHISTAISDWFCQYRADQPAPPPPARSVIVVLEPDPDLLDVPF